MASSHISDEIVLFVRDGGRLGGGEPTRAELSGTKGLMLAVLEDAIRCYLAPPARTTWEAEAWVGSDNRGVFSFLTICETLGLEPDAVRRALKRLKGTQKHIDIAVRQRGRRTRKLSPS